MTKEEKTIKARLKKSREASKRLFGDKKNQTCQVLTENLIKELLWLWSPNQLKYLIYKVVEDLKKEGKNS